MNIIKKYRDQARDYGVPFWRLPDILLIMMALLNIIIMLVTYWWLSIGMEDPRQAIIPVALEAILILTIGNIITETSKKIISGQKLKKEFINIISHQMRTPLTISKWSLEMLQKDKSRESNKKYINKTIEANKRMMSIVNDFVNLARMQDEIKKIETEKFDAVKVMENVISEAKFFSEAQKVDIVLEKKKDKIWVNADKEKTKTVFNNIIDNALKYSPSNSKIKVMLSEDGGFFIAEIKDSGIGINKEDQKYIFTKFYRSSDARRACSSGTGSGLYICREILNKMGGKIWFDTKDGVGTSFFVTIPLWKNK